MIKSAGVSVNFSQEARPCRNCNLLTEAQYLYYSDHCGACTLMRRKDINSRIEIMAMRGLNGGKVECPTQ